MRLKTELFSLESSYEEKIKIIAKKSSLHLTTGKSIYNNGDNVTYQVLVLDAEMKPYHYNSLSLTFNNMEGRKVSSRKLFNSGTGFFEGHFTLKDKMIDVRTIEAAINSEPTSVKQNFDIANPKAARLQLHVDPFANDVTFEDGKITAIIYAMDGLRTVKGKAKVKATVFNVKNLEKQVAGSTKTIDVSSTNSVVSFDFVQDFAIDGSFNSIVKLNVEFAEKSSRRSETADAVVAVHRDVKYKFEAVGDGEPFVPGKLYKFKVLIKNFDNSIVKEKETATLNVRKQFFKSCTFSKTAFPTEIGTTHVSKLTRSTALKNGVAEFEINAPIDAESLIFRVQYKNSFKDVKVDKKIEKKSVSDLELSVDVGRYVTMKVVDIVSAY